MRKYYISISGTARRMLRKQCPQFYERYKDVLEKMYEVRAENGNTAKRLFKEQYREAAVFKAAARLLRITFLETLRAYPG